MTVSTLRKAILERHLLQGVPAKSLEIWKVSIAVDDLRVKLANIKLKDCAWDGVEKLGLRRRVFPDSPMDGFLHIPVRPASEYAWFLP
jgi:hypothetical protein